MSGGLDEKSSVTWRTACGVIALTLLCNFLVVPVCFPRGDVSLYRWIAGIALPPAALILAIFALFRRSGENTQIRMPTAKDWLVIATGYGMAILLPAVLTPLWVHFLTRTGFHVPTEQPLLAIARAVAPERYGVLVLTTVFFIPVIEELCFRKSLFSLFLNLGEKRAVILTSALFSAVHFFIAGLPGLFALGVILQCAYCRTKNLAVAIIIHALFNLTSMLAIRFLH